MSLYDHMSWCHGDHQPDTGECVISMMIDEVAEVWLQGVPCDSMQVYLDGWLAGVEAIDAAIETLVRFRGLYAASEPETTCETHLHD